MKGCGDWGCLIETPKGVGTNGGCRCFNRLNQKTKIEVQQKLNSLSFYKKRVLELEKHKDKFPEPYYTMICNILANGRIDHK